MVPIIELLMRIFFTGRYPLFSLGIFWVPTCRLFLLGKIEHAFGKLFHPKNRKEKGSKCWKNKIHVYVQIVTNKNKGHEELHDLSLVFSFSCVFDTIIIHEYSQNSYWILHMRTQQHLVQVKVRAHTHFDTDLQLAYLFLFHG